MTKITRVASIDEAVKLAQEWKENGEYDLFRGQNKNWGLIASANRLSIKKRNEAIKRIENLWGYFHLKPYFKEYIKDVHTFYAIAQHYGVPTQYIDFTSNPKVAAFFATYKKRYRKPEEGVILCVNSTKFKELIQFCNTIFEKYKHENPDMEALPEFIKIQVANLWRLEAQDGCFLYLPYGDFEKTFGAFDRIIFPYSMASENSELYIPKIKSLLEEDIEQFFRIERQQRNMNWFIKHMKNACEEIALFQLFKT